MVSESTPRSDASRSNSVSRAAAAAISSVRPSSRTFGKLHGGQQRQRLPRLRRTANGGLTIGKQIHVLLQARQLERDRARIGLVGQQQIEHQVGLQGGQIARAVGDGAVGDLQNRFQHAHAGRLGTQAVAQHVGHLHRALQAPADVQEAPAVAARHALHHDAGKGRERNDDVIQAILRAADAKRLGRSSQGKLLIQLVEDEPCVHRNAIPQQPRDAAHPMDPTDQAVGRGGIVDHGQHLALRRDGADRAPADSRARTESRGRR